MYIKRLNLRAFGKFINKRISFDDRFNIVFGENESGKSTIHNFIECVMYGMDGVPVHNKYKPWNSSLYKGSIEIGQGEKSYIISRNFLLDTVQVFKRTDEALEENEDNEINDFLIEDIEVPGDHFFNINRISFNNTISISQLGNKTESELAGELKSKIMNLSSTRDEDISIERILRSLNGIKEDAGREDDEKSLLGQYVLRLEELGKAKESSLISSRQVMFLAMEKKKLQSKIHQLNLKIQEKQKEISDYELSLEKQKFLKAQPHVAEIEKITEELKLIEGDVEACSKEDYIEASETESSLASLKNERQRLIEEKEDCLSELKINEEDLSNYIPSDFDPDKLNEDYALFRANEEKIRGLNEKIKGDLIKKAIGTDKLPINTPEETIGFPWFPLKGDVDEVEHHEKFIEALCRMAINQKRVTAKAVKSENEKYDFRCFLLRLGFIGDEHRAFRRYYLRNLSGNTAFKKGKKE
jgi:exonuclease SbcC